MSYIKYLIVILSFAAAFAYIGCESNDSSVNSVYIPQPVNKKVLVEFFTNAGCNPCIAAHNYLDKITANTGATINDTSVIIISYHTKYPYSFDSLYRANVSQNEYRSTTYYGINFTPQCRIDGTNAGQFSAGNWSAQINAEFRTTRYLNISLANTFDFNTDTGTVSADISLVSALPSSDNVVHVVISESNVSYVTSPNGITNPDDVMRYMLTGQEGESINVGQNTTVTKTYGLSPNWDSEECYITVFVQSVSTKQVFGVERIKVVK
jgi:hypothetical protein